MTYEKLKTPVFERFDEEEYKNYEVTEADFVAACNQASYWAKRRILKKMQKTVERKASWVPTAAGVLHVGPKGMVQRESLPPSNVEEAVKAFVFNNKEKEAK